MAKTTVGDIVFHPRFQPYVMEGTAQKNRFVQSDIVDRNPLWKAYAAAGGNKVHLPFWQALVSGRQIISDGVPFALNRITAGQDMAAIHYDGNAWGVNGLAKMLAGEDPMKAIASQFTDHWANVEEATIISCLKGVFAAETMAGHVLDISAMAAGAAIISPEAFVDATALLGDRSELLGGVVMPSATEAYLRKKDQIDVIPGSDGKPLLRIYQGRRVIVDDRIPSADGVFDMYLFGSGAFIHGAADLNGEPIEGGHGTEGVEMLRDGLHHDSVVINRRRYILHPRGVKYKADIAGSSPSNEQLETGANWERVYESKNVKLALLRHRLALAA